MWHTWILLHWIWPRFTVELQVLRFRYTSISSIQRSSFQSLTYSTFSLDQEIPIQKLLKAVFKANWRSLMHTRPWYSPNPRSNLKGQWWRRKWYLGCWNQQLKQQRSHIFISMEVGVCNSSVRTCWVDSWRRLARHTQAIIGIQVWFSYWSSSHPVEQFRRVSHHQNVSHHDLTAVSCW